MKRQLDEAEEEISRHKAMKRKTQREMDDMLESQEELTREVANLKNKLRRGGPSICLSSRLKRGSVQTGGSGDDSTTQDESIDGEETVN